MLNEHLTIILLSTTFIGGQAVLIGYVVYKNAFLNNVVLNNAAYEVEQEQEQEQEQELQPEEYENADDEEENEEDSGADADNEEGTLNSVPPITTNTPATAAPVINDTCVDCDDDCMKCMPPLTLHGLMTGLSGEIPAGVVCEGGVCRIDTSATSTINAMMEELIENVKID
jgi:hypothetical protein